MKNVFCEYVTIFPPHLVFVNKTPDTSSNLTGKQDDQAGKELERREIKVIMYTTLPELLTTIMLILNTNYM